MTLLTDCSNSAACSHPLSIPETNAVRNMPDADVSEKVDEFVKTFGHSPVRNSLISLSL